MPGYQSGDNLPRTTDGNKEGYLRTSIARASPLFPVVDDPSTLDTPPDTHILFGWWLLLTVAMSGFSIVPAWAADDWQPSSYEERFVNPTNGVHLKDNNVWVYNRGFAERFGMPERWINEELDGAEAVAYRVEAQNIASCGYFGEPDNCRTDYYCTFDLYLADRDSKKWPWKTGRVVEYAKEDSSVLFLSAQSRSDQKGWIEEEQRTDRSNLNIGLDSLGWVSGPPREGKVYSGSSDRVRVMSYDREIFDGLDYLKLAASCSIAREERDVRIFFQEEFPTPTDYGFRYVGKALRVSPEDEARFERIKKAWFQSKFRGDVPHVVTLPDYYMVRVKEYDRREYQPKSLATEVERRLEKRDTDDPNTKHWWQKLFDL